MFRSRKLLPHQVRAKYQIPDAVTFITRNTDSGVILVTSNELPGFMTQAEKESELIDMVNDALLTYFDVPKSVCENYIYSLKRADGHVIRAQAIEKLQAA